MAFKGLILIEFSLAYCVPVVLLIPGFAVAPYLLVLAFMSLSYILVFLGATLLLSGAVVGLWASIQLLCKTMDPGLIIGKPRRLLRFLVCGVASLLAVTPFVALVAPGLVIAAMLLPIPVAIHLVYLNRTYLWAIPAALEGS